jgi:ABC-type Co2+ transport system permease subunit
MLENLGNLIWRSDTRHSEAMLSWSMLGMSFTHLLAFASHSQPGFLVYSVAMFVVALLGFVASVHGSYLARIQCAMLRTFCWPAVGIHAALTATLMWYTLPFYAFLAIAEAVIYIKLYLLLNKHREESNSGGE